MNIDEINDGLDLIAQRVGLDPETATTEEIVQATLAEILEDHFAAVLQELAQGWGPWKLVDGHLRHDAGHTLSLDDSPAAVAGADWLSCYDVGCALLALRTCRYAKFLEIGPWSKGVPASTFNQPPGHRDTCGCRGCCAWKNAQRAPTPTWPCDDTSGRMLCTRTRPKPAESLGRWRHPDATCVLSGEYVDRYKCPHCGVMWTEELPE